MSLSALLVACGSGDDTKADTNTESDTETNAEDNTEDYYNEVKDYAVTNNLEIDDGEENEIFSANYDNGDSLLFRITDTEFPAITI